MVEDIPIDPAGLKHTALSGLAKEGGSLGYYSRSFGTFSHSVLATGLLQQTL